MHSADQSRITGAFGVPEHFVEQLELVTAWDESEAGLSLAQSGLDALSPRRVVPLSHRNTLQLEAISTNISPDQDDPG